VILPPVRLAGSWFRAASFPVVDPGGQVGTAYEGQACSLYS
jgi:hypothetical protein